MNYKGFKLWESNYPIHAYNNCNAQSLSYLIFFQQFALPALNQGLSLSVKPHDWLNKTAGLSIKIFSLKQNVFYFQYCGPLLGEMHAALSSLRSVQEFTWEMRSIRYIMQFNSYQLNLLSLLSPSLFLLNVKSRGQMVLKYTQCV